MKDELINKIKEALIGDRESYFELRSEIEFCYGYNYFRDLQEKAFEELFSVKSESYKKYRDKK